MTIVFTYPSLFVLFITTLPIIIGYTLLIQTGGLEWETMKYPRLLMFIGLVNSIFNLSIFFIPSITVINGTFLETNLFITYIFTRGLVLFFIESVILGVPLIFLGIKNKNPHGQYLILAGLLIIISEAINFYLLGYLQLNFLFSRAALSTMVFWTFISGVFSLLPFIVLIQYGNKKENKALILAGAILLYGQIVSLIAVDDSTLGFAFGLMIFYILLSITEIIIHYFNKSQNTKMKHELAPKT